jgi:predicted nucleic acid-binding protein
MNTDESCWKSRFSVVLICAVAVRHGLKILTTDTDFAAYAKHILIKLHLPRGVALG